MLSADRRGLFVAGGDGAISEGNLTLGSAKETPVPGDQHEFITPFASPGALGRARFYVGAGRADHQGVAGDPRFRHEHVGARRHDSHQHAVRVRGGDQGRLGDLRVDRGALAIDPVARRELRATAVGRAPSFALIAP